MLRRAGRLVLLGGVLWFGLHELREMRRFPNYEQVVALVKSGALKADRSGDIRLPQLWSSVTQNGHVYQMHDKESGLVLLFPTDVRELSIDWDDGKTTKELEIAGYVYCSGPLPKDGWFSFQGLSGVSTWDENKPVHPHWYYVEPFYSD